MPKSSMMSELPANVIEAKKPILDSPYNQGYFLKNTYSKNICIFMSLNIN